MSRSTASGTSTSSATTASAGRHEEQRAPARSQRVADQLDERAGVAPVDQRVEGPVQRLATKPTSRSLKTAASPSTDPPTSASAVRTRAEPGREHQHHREEDQRLERGAAGRPRPAAPPGWSGAVSATSTSAPPARSAATPCAEHPGGPALNRAHDLSVHTTSRQEHENERAGPLLRFTRDHARGPMPQRGAGVLVARARRGRDPACPAPDAATGRGARPHAPLRHQPGHRDAGLRRAGPARPVRRHAGTLPGGRLPGAGEVRLPQRGCRGARSRRSCWAVPSSACTPTRRRTSCRRPRSPSCRRRCPPTGRCSPGLVETAVNALWDAGPLLGDRVAVVGAGSAGLLRGAAARPHARGLGHPGRRRPVPGHGRAGPRRGLLPARRGARRAATWWCTRAPRPRGCSGRWSCSLPRARSSS